MTIRLARRYDQADLVQVRSPAQQQPMVDVVEIPGVCDRVEQFECETPHARRLFSIDAITPSPSVDRTLLHVLGAAACREVVQQTMLQRRVDKLEPLHVEPIE